MFSNMDCYKYTKLMDVIPIYSTTGKVVGEGLDRQNSFKCELLELRLRGYTCAIACSIKLKRCEKIFFAISKDLAFLIHKNKAVVSGMSSTVPAKVP